KKHTGKLTVNYNEAVEEALCFGWIDSLIKRIDEEKYMQKFTPRSDNSLWSELNKQRVKKMISEGKMTEAGLQKVRVAKQNGKWDEDTDAKKDFTLTSELISVLKSDKNAFEKFESLTPSHKRNYTTWIMSARKTETQERRMKNMIEMLKNGNNMF
ncbi:MAG: YdeI/OmpD-associated family protein, partial [Bacteroidales bacterium]|nr:YdeI/OmpD-associated family protein [Bacteroidales bacterium]